MNVDSMLQRYQNEVAHISLTESVAAGRRATVINTRISA
jgi:hypothetical protein